MNRVLLDQIVQTTLYEGYILYPYRASSKKNARERFTFGRVYPAAYSAAQEGAEPCLMQAECVVNAVHPGATVEISLRFLQPMARDITWHEAVERSIPLPVIELTGAHTSHTPFQFPASDDGTRVCAALEGSIDVTVQPLEGSLFKISVKVRNDSRLLPEELNDANAVLLRLFASSHVILCTTGGQFSSQLESPAAEICQNIGVWPVLVGDEGDMMLASPIILYDQPKLAPESAGALFDGTEIDEILTLRILTMTDEEKNEMRNVDEQARRLLERTEALPQESLLKMHGMMRETEPAGPVKGVSVGGVFLQPGVRVRIRPKGRGDIMDIAIAGQIAVIEAVEQDFEDRIHFAVVLENDPGRDLGMLRQPGHRFFYGVDEVEPVEEVAL